MPVYHKHISLLKVKNFTDVVAVQKEKKQKKMILFLSLLSNKRSSARYNKRLVPVPGARCKGSLAF
jgi:hypothetical protein